MAQLAQQRLIRPKGIPKLKISREPMTIEAELHINFSKSTKSLI